MNRLALGSLGLSGRPLGFRLVMGLYPVGLECLLLIGPVLKSPHTFSLFFSKFLAVIKDTPKKLLLKDGHNY